MPSLYDEKKSGDTKTEEPDQVYAVQQPIILIVSHLADPYEL